MSNIPLRLSMTPMNLKRFIDIPAFVLMSCSLMLQTTAEGQTAAKDSGGPDQAREMLDAYCVDCHNAQLKSGGIALDKLDVHSPGTDAATWEKALRKLRGRLMPPPGNPQPEQKDIDTFIAWMEKSLDAYAADARNAGPKAGYVPIERLNRTEYAASVKALVGVDVNAKEVLPQDIQVGGFDNIAAALNISPAFLDQYITAARQVAKVAIGNRNPRVSSVPYSVNAMQNSGNPLPPGTHGGIRFKHNFPADGEYRITMTDLGVGPYSNALENESTMVILIDGKIVFRKSIGGAADLSLADRQAGTGRAKIMERFAKIPVTVQAGVRDVVVAFIDHAPADTGENLEKLEGYGGLTGSAAPLSRMAELRGNVEVAGPFNPTGVSMTPSRELIFVCDPKTAGETACARKIAENLARRAFRRPVSAEEVDKLMPFYQAGRASSGSFDHGIEEVVAAVLASPDFLFRSIRGASADKKQGSSPNKESSLTDLELASRLSFFLWNTGPDEGLLSLAAAGGLTKPGVVEKQVRRMLADPKASSLVTSFAMKWLNLGDLEAVQPDPKLFPAFSEPLRRDFSAEAEQFLSSILLEDRSVLDLLTADYTFLNDRLAQHYGISGVTGSQFRKVTLTDKERFGLLGKGAVLLRTSYGDRTSPVLRGAWVLDKLMGTPPSPPPPNVAGNLDTKEGEAPKTIRARLEQHREKAVCMQCHGVIDPVGLPLENFDAIGQWRTADRQANNVKIDASTVLPNGTPIDGPIELRSQLAGHPAMFAQALAEKLMMYALNRQLEYFDMPQVRAVVRGAAKDNYKFSSLILGVVNTDAFRKQGPAPATTQTGVAVASTK